MHARPGTPCRATPRLHAPPHLHPHTCMHADSGASTTHGIAHCPFGLPLLALGHQPGAAHASCVMRTSTAVQRGTPYFHPALPPFSHSVACIAALAHCRVHVLAQTRLCFRHDDGGDGGKARCPPIFSGRIGDAHPSCFLCLMYVCMSMALSTHARHTYHKPSYFGLSFSAVRTLLKCTRFLLDFSLSPARQQQGTTVL